MSNSAPKIYLLPGMTFEFPVFTKLAKELPGTEVVKYADPFANESINAYAKRLADQMSPNSYIVGISFGGILAQEIAKHLRPKGCVVISSVSSCSQLPPWFRVGRLLRTDQLCTLLRSIGYMASIFPSRIATRTTIRARKLSGDEGQWHRWATAAVIAWNSTEPINPLLKIHGDADTTFPIRYVDPDVCIRGGKHALTLSHPKETADAIREFMNAA